MSNTKDILFTTIIEPSKEIIDLETRLWWRHLQRKLESRIAPHELSGLPHPSITWSVLENGRYSSDYCGVNSIVFFTEKSSSWVKEVVEFSNQELREMGGFSSSTFEKTKENNTYVNYIKAAFEAVSTASPSYSYLLRQFSLQLIIGQSDELIAASSQTALGAILLSPKEDWTLPVYIDRLIHECSHIELYIRMLCDPLVHPGSNPLYSPIRKTDRPQIGLVHASFVLVRVCMILAIVINNGTLSNDDEVAAIELFERNFTILDETLDLLEQKANLTEIGQQLVTNIRIYTDSILQGWLSNG